MLVTESLSQTLRKCIETRGVKENIFEREREMSTSIRKKVENKLGSKMIYLKIRCSDFESDQGKDMALRVYRFSASYVGQRTKNLTARNNELFGCMGNKSMIFFLMETSWCSC